MSESPDFFARHRELLERAVRATTERASWSPYPEMPNDPSYGENGMAAGAEAFEAQLGKPFELGQPGELVAAGEVSPYGLELAISYPYLAPDEAVATAKTAGRAWRRASADTRAGVAAEILARLNAASFEIAQAVQHTTGQAFAMAFQAGGPHAQDRGLEAVAYAWAEQKHHPASAIWSKPQRKGDPITMEKTFTPVGRGVALVIACVTFPTWNSYPGLFASLVTGNPVLVKPHPRAILPLAVTVRIAREVLAEAGFDPNVALLVPEKPGSPNAGDLARHPDVRIIDYTGSTSFGDWLEQNARQAVVYAEKAGLNTVVLDSTDNYKGLLANLAFSLSLYSGQMCTTPQNLLIARTGMSTDQGVKTPGQFAQDLSAALDGLLGDPKRAAGILGAITSTAVTERLEQAAATGSVVHPSSAVENPQHPEAVVRTPLVVALASTGEEVYTREWFGPISFVIETESTKESLELLRRTVGDHGALTAMVHSTDPEVLEAARDAALDVGVHLSENLTTPAVFVNQTTAFSDFHGSPASPAATAALSDPAYVTGRFTTLQSRRHVAPV
ncbi:MAG: phenylacetic acid degradation protein PaaN [Kineosporiaceae bacterium]|nr:phenylacetic acid degradation protein PaaN [Kineosporiaceae bacterium]MBK7621589.1 phenylacetic acid degradation protein PaaN [Kineosporiaceae bacterium]MBK8077245.1 phenylacetic acid degradation protein PaaN [Kineosporiaceae bacterium]